MKSIIFYILVCAALALLSCELHAKTRLEIQPVRINKEGNNWLLWYRLPCQSKSVGIYISHNKATTLDIGVATVSEDVACTSSDEIRRFKLDAQLSHWLAQQSRPVVSYNPRFDGQNLAFSPSKYIASPYFHEKIDLKKPTKSPSVLVGYRTQCGVVAGLLLQPGTRALQMGVIENLDLKAIDCKKQQTKTILLEAFDLKKPLSALELDPQTSDTYSLEIMPIRPKSLVYKNERLHLRYLRKCYQAPIGLIKQVSKEATYIAILVASYDPTNCSKPGRSFWTSYWTTVIAKDDFSRLKIARIPSKIKLEMMPMTSPVERVASNEIEVSVLSKSCKIKPIEVWGATKGKLNLGLLVAETKKKPCKKIHYERNIRIQLENPTAANQQVQELKLSH